MINTSNSLAQNDWLDRYNAAKFFEDIGMQLEGDCESE